MNRVFSRPLFRGNFIKRYAQGGIVSTVAGPEEVDPMSVLTGMAEQVDMTEKNLDASNSIDEILTSFAGTPKTAQDARAELAELVGPADADATPESVLALVQPAMAIMEMSRQMGPGGGIASMPMDPQAALMEGAAPTNFTQAPNGAPVPGFAAGGGVNYDQIMQDYAGMQAAIPKQYGADPASAWLALAQMGAGMAQGRTFAEGLSRGTQMAAPVMQQGIQNVRDERGRLSAFVAAEATRQKQEKAAIDDREDQQKFSAEQARIGRGFEAAEAEKNRNFQGREGMLNRGMTASQHLDTLKQRQYEFEIGWERDLTKMQMEAENEYRIKLQEAATEAEKLRLTQEFELKKLGIQQEMDLIKIEHQAKFKNLETSAVERMIDDYMAGSGLTKGTKEYNDLKQTLIREQLAKQDGMTLNLGDKGSSAAITAQTASEEKVFEEITKAGESARQTRAAIAPVLQMLQGVDKGEAPSFQTGGFGPTRVAVGQVVEFVDKNYAPGLADGLKKFIGGDVAAGEIMRASMADLKIALSGQLSRVTNLQLTVLDEALPNLAMTPQGNYFIAKVLDRKAQRELKLEEYAMRLRETYGGSLDPAIKPREYRDELLAGAGVTSFDGYKTGRPFDDNGNPIMSLTQYKLHLDKTDPLLTNEDLAQIKKLSDTTPSDPASLLQSWTGEQRASGQDWNAIGVGKKFFDPDDNGYWIRTKDGRVPDPNPDPNVLRNR